MKHITNTAWRGEAGGPKKKESGPKLCVVKDEEGKPCLKIGLRMGRQGRVYCQNHYDHAKRDMKKDSRMNESINGLEGFWAEQARLERIR